MLRILSLLFILPTLAAAQSNDELRDGNVVGYDSGYVTSFRDHFVLTLVNETKAGELDVTYKATNKAYQLLYRANTVNTWGFSIDYKWITLDYTTRMPWTSADPAKGETKNKGLGFGITGRRLAFRNFYESTKGFYLSNTDKILPEYNITNKSYYTRPDIQTFSYFSSLNYIFNNKRFSTNASIWQLERQQRFAGSFVAGLVYIYNRFDADSSIIPISIVDSLARKGNSSFTLNSLGINLGYQFTFPFGKSRKMYVTLAIIPGLSRQWGEVAAEKVNTLKVNNLTGFQSETRFGFGYNGDRWYAGFTGRVYSNLNFIEEQQPISISTQFARLHFGYRFNAIRFAGEWWKKWGL